MEKTLKSPLESKEIKPVNLKGNQLWILFGRTDDESEAPILWPPEANSWLNGKDPDAGKDWRQEKRATEDEMVGWHHRRNGHELGQAPRDGEQQGGLACCGPWDCKELDMTWQLNSEHHGWLMLVYGRNQHNIIKHYSPFKNKFKKRDREKWGSWCLQDTQGHPRCAATGRGGRSAQ